MGGIHLYILTVTMLVYTAGCADLQDACIRDPEQCGKSLPSDEGSNPDSGVPDSGTSDCGNKSVEHGEACDDGNTVSHDGCNENCLSNEKCGTGYHDVAQGEVCDDGNNITETACPYGTQDCIQCNSDCKAVLILSGPYCGDDTLNGIEACDDGNTLTESACPYGTPSCSKCTADCSLSLNLLGPYCGDGFRNGPEACDDGNTSSCGTCGPSCSTVQFSMATGLIDSISSEELFDTETLTLDDGTHPPVVFEFDKNGVWDPAHVRVTVSAGDADQTAAIIRDAINEVGDSLQLTAQITVPTDFVRLTHDLAGTFGNQPITESVSNALFSVSGMSGGQGRDCPQGTGCTWSEDCARGLVCLSNRTCGPSPLLPGTDR